MPLEYIFFYAWLCIRMEFIYLRLHVFFSFLVLGKWILGRKTCFGCLGGPAALSSGRCFYLYVIIFPLVYSADKTWADRLRNSSRSTILNWKRSFFFDLFFSFLQVNKGRLARKSRLDLQSELSAIQSASPPLFLIYVLFNIRPPSACSVQFHYGSLRN